jgi:predicted transcriptional regulator
MVRRSRRINTVDFLNVIRELYLLLNGKTLQGKKATYGSFFVNLRYALILFAAITLDIIKDENEDEDEDRVRNCTPLNYYALKKVADMLHLDFDRTRSAKKIYTQLIDKGIAKIERIGGKEYICLTEKGE